MSIKKTLRAALGLCLVSAPLALMGCDETKPETKPATTGGAAAPSTATPPPPADKK